MAIKDRNIAWLRQSRIITLSDFYGANSHTATAGTPSVQGFGEGNPILTEVSTFGVGAGVPAADNDTFTTIDLQSPRLWNPEEEIGCRVWYIAMTGDAAATDDVTFVVSYKAFNEDQAIVDPATALDTVIPEHRAGAGIATIGATARTARGVINGGSFTWENRGGGVCWEVKMTSADYEADEIGFIGLEIDYAPKLCVDGNEDVEYFKNLAATS